MTTDSDSTTTTTTNTDLELIRWRHGMTNFRYINLRVQGSDEAGCLDALDTELRKFAVDPAQWTLTSARYTRETAQSLAGETTITVWMLDAILVKAEGIVSWAGIEE